MIGASYVLVLPVSVQNTWSKNSLPWFLTLSEQLCINIDGSITDLYPVLWCFQWHISKAMQVNMDFIYVEWVCISISLDDTVLAIQPIQIKHHLLP